MGELTELERLRAENDYLRGLVQHNPEWKCVHGYDVPSMAHCPLGFPGCACADDLLLAADRAYQNQCETDPCTP